MKQSRKRRNSTQGLSSNASNQNSDVCKAPSELDHSQEPLENTHISADSLATSKLLMGKLELEWCNPLLCMLPMLSVVFILIVMVALSWSVTSVKNSAKAANGIKAPTGGKRLVSLYLGTEFYDRLPQLDDSPATPKRDGEYVYSTEFLRSAGSLRWFAALFLHIFICIVAACVSLLILIRSVNHKSWRHCFILAVLTVGFAVLISRYFPVRLIYSWDSQFYRPTHQTHWLLACTVVRDWGVDFQRILDLPARLTIIVGLIIVVSFGVALLPRQINGESELASVLERLRWNRTLLYAGAALLVGMLVQTSFLFQWALSYLYPSKDGTLYSSLENLASSIATHQGIGFTVLLAAAYIPTVPVLNGQVLRWAVSAPELQNKLVVERDKWLMDSGVIAAPADTVGKFIAVLTPLLVGSAGEIIKGLVSK